MKSVNTKLQVTDYPYGFKKTTAFFSIEFKKGKGFRSVFQTINPSSGKLNAPKYGTYSPVMYMEQDNNGFVEYKKLDFYGWSGFANDTKTMVELFDLFTKEQICDIYAHLFMLMKANTKAQVLYCGTSLDDLKPYITEIIGTITLAYKSGENIFEKISKIDVEGIESTKVEGFSPFKTTEIYSIQ